MRKQMEPNDFYNMFRILKEEDISETERNNQFNYWTKRVMQRIEYLTPLIEELKIKKLDLATISKELHQEWLELNECKNYFNM